MLGSEDFHRNHDVVVELVRIVATNLAGLGAGVDGVKEPRDDDVTPESSEEVPPEKFRSWWRQT